MQQRILLSLLIGARAAFLPLLLTLGLFVLAGCSDEGAVRRKAERRLSGDLCSGDQGRRLAAARALGVLAREGNHATGPAASLEPQTRAALTRALADPRYRLRVQSALALAWTPGAPEGTVGVLREALSDPGIALLHWEAAQLRLNHDPRAEAGYALFLQNLKNHFPAAPMVGVTNPADALSTATLALVQARAQALVKAADPKASVEGALALGRLACATAPAVSALQTKLKDPVPAVRQAAVWALGQMGTAAFSALTGVKIRMNEPDPAMQAIAARALARIDPQSRNTVLTMAEVLASPDPRLRVACAEALMAYGADARPIHEAVPLDRLKDVVWAQNLAMRVIEPAFGALLKCLNDPDPRVRATAAATLGRISPDDEKAAAALLPLLNDPVTRVRCAALWALGELGVSSPKLLDDLHWSLRDSQEAVRMAAVGLLGKVAAEEKATPKNLQHALSDASPNVRAAAAGALSRLSPALAGDPELVGQLIKLLKDPFPDVRGAAAVALGHADLNTDEAVGLLAGLLRDPQPTVRGQAALALGWRGAEARGASPALLALAHQNGADALDAALALGWIGEPAAVEALLRQMSAPAFWQNENALDSVAESRAAAGPATDAWPDDPVALLKMLARTERPDLRGEAIVVLGWLGERARPASPLLTGYLKNRANPIELRLLAATGLAAIAPELKNPLFPTLIAAIRDEQARLREDAAVALAGLGRKAAPALPELLRIARGQDNPYSLRCAALAALGAAGAGAKEAGGVAAALAEIMKDRDESLRSAAALAMGELGVPGSSAPALVAAAHDAEPAVREAAARALGQAVHPTDAAVTALGVALQDADSQVQLAAAGALRRLGAAARAARPALLAAREDPNPLVREAAGGEHGKGQ